MDEERDRRVDRLEEGNSCDSGGGSACSGGGGAAARGTVYVSESRRVGSRGSVIKVCLLTATTSVVGITVDVNIYFSRFVKPPKRFKQLNTIDILLKYARKKNC